MFDIGWTELLLIGIVALIVVGPKDLPAMFHTLGRFVARAKGMAREFQDAMNEAAKEAGVDEVAADLKKATSARSLGLDKLQEAATKFENWDPSVPDKKTGKKPSPDKDADSPEDKALQKERAAVGEKIHSATVKAASARKAKSGEDAGDTAAAPIAKKPAAKKPAAKKPAAKKPAAKKPAAKKPARKPATKAAASKARP